MKSQWTINEFGTFKKIWPLRYSIKIRNYGMRETHFLVYMVAYHVISKEIENRIFRHNRYFRHVCIKNPYWQSSGIITFLWKILYSYRRYTDRLLDVFFLLLTVILSEFHEKLRKKNSVTEKSTWKNLCEGHHFFGCAPTFLCYFLSLFSSTPSPYPSDILVEWTL